MAKVSKKKTENSKEKIPIPAPQIQENLIIPIPELSEEDLRQQELRRAQANRQHSRYGRDNSLR